MLPWWAGGRESRNKEVKPGISETKCYEEKEKWILG